VEKHLKAMDVTIVGAGMIVHDLILPAVYHLQRLGAVERIVVCGTRPASLRALRDNREILEAFPGQGFAAFPDPAATAPAGPGLYREVLARAAPRQLAIIALPDPLHHEAVMAALACDQHVLCVKPLVLTHREGVEIENAARAKGLLVGVEYHKRRDRRALMARKRYRRGELGELVMGEAKMIEPYYYRRSNFQNWFTCAATDPFVYVGCHYVDQVYFITGLRPTALSVCGVKGRFPNGVEGYLWANGRVRFENGALLSVTSGLGYPDDGAGPNEQGLSLFFEGEARAACLKHNDQFRGVEYSFLEGRGPAGKRFHYVSPDFFQLVPWEGPGERPVGYGYDSVAAVIDAAARVEAQAAAEPSRAMETRRAALAAIDAQELIATPANSFINELVHEAARLSLANDGDTALIEYEPAPRVRLRSQAQKP
jgi:D-galacturonate reductase